MLLMLSQIQTLMLRLPLCKPRIRKSQLRSQPPPNQLVEMRVLELRDNTNQEKKVLVNSEVAEAASEAVAEDSEVATEVATKLTDNSMKREENSEKAAEAASEVAAVVSEVVTDNNNHNTDQRLQQLKAVTRVSFTE